MYHVRVLQDIYEMEIFAWHDFSEGHCTMRVGLLVSAFRGARCVTVQLQASKPSREY